MSAAVLVAVTAAARGILGYGWWFTILAAVHGVLNVLAYIAIVREQRAYREMAQQLPTRMEVSANRADSSG